MVKVISLIFVGTMLGTYGHILFKKSINTHERPDLGSFSLYLKFVIKTIRRPAIWFGMGFVGTGIFFWLLALAQVDLSIAYPIDSMQYIMTIVMARIFLGEKIDWMKIFGTLFIVAGILLVALS